MVAFHDIFSVVAFFVFLRETLEASVIIAVLLQCMNRTMPRLKRQGERVKPGQGCVSIAGFCGQMAQSKVAAGQH
jgi:high-affinity Fe2+/Pb2+ permease